MRAKSSSSSAQSANRFGLSPPWNWPWMWKAPRLLDSITNRSDTGVPKHPTNRSGYGLVQVSS